MHDRRIRLDFEVSSLSEFGIYIVDVKRKRIPIASRQLKFHSAPYGKLGSCQLLMNNETSPALLIFYLMWNSPLLFPKKRSQESKENSRVVFSHMHEIECEG